MKFDYIIGNPPFDITGEGDNKNTKKPIYHMFMDSAYQLSDRVVLIHPGRFLFNAGSTPKDWNLKMLSDPHFKVLWYEPKSTAVFNNTDIKGGIAVTYHDNATYFGAIETFYSYPELNSILNKVKDCDSYESFESIVYSRTSYRLTDKMHKDNPEAINMLSEGHPYDMSSNIFELLPQIFFNDKPNDEYQYIQLLGREENKRIYKWIRRDYVNDVENFNGYKVLVPAANGSGSLGETLSSPLIAQPQIGHTEAFISIGNFDNSEEALALLKYIKTKFARCMLGILKVTQHNPPAKWRYVPMQSFTDKSDIDWSKSISEIDKQLYKKYKLDNKEIDFIETHVKEME